MTNLRFVYMYRDASNYKQHGEAIFSNEKQLPVDEIENQVHACLNDGEYFIARQIHIEERFFEALYDDDHPWHEFVRVEGTSAPTFDPEGDHQRDITEFVAELETAHSAGWNEMNVREDLAKQLTEQKRVLKEKLVPKAEGMDDNPSCG